MVSCTVKAVPAQHGQLHGPYCTELAAKVGGLGLEGWGTAGQRPERDSHSGGRVADNAFGRVGGGVGYGLGAWVGHKGDPANDREPRWGFLETRSVRHVTSRLYTRI